MPWSSFHRGDYARMRRNLTIALLEAESLEPRLQLAYSRGLVPDELAAKMGLVRLHLERAHLLVRDALDVAIGDTREYFDIYAETTFSDRALVEGPLPHRAA